MLLYDVFLHEWIHFGTDAADLRSLSVIFAVAGAAMVYLLARQLFGQAVGLTAGLLLGISTFAVTYAQTARSYSLFLFLSTATSYCFVRALGSTERRWWIAYAIVGGLSIYAHLFAVLVLVAHGVYLLIKRPTREVWRRAVLSWVGAAGLCIPVALMASSKGSSQISWIPHTTLGAILQVGFAITGGTALFLVFLVIVLYAFLVAVYRAGSDWSWNVTFLLCAIAVPPIVTLVVSVEKPLWVSYYLIECLPPIVILVSAALWSFPLRWFTAVGTVAVAALAVFSLIDYYNAPPVQNWRGAVAYAISDLPANSLIIVAGELQPVEYYLQQDRPKLLNDVVHAHLARELSHGKANQCSHPKGHRLAICAARSAGSVIVFTEPSNGAEEVLPLISRDLAKDGFERQSLKRFVGHLSVIWYTHV